MFVSNNEIAAVAAAHRVDPQRWQGAFSAVLDRVESRFARYEPLRHAARLMLGMLGPLERKNCWTIAEHRGDLTPDGLQLRFQTLDVPTTRGSSAAASWSGCDRCR